MFCLFFFVVVVVSHIIWPYDALYVIQASEPLTYDWSPNATNSLYLSFAALPSAPIHPSIHLIVYHLNE